MADIETAYQYELQDIGKLLEDDFGGADAIRDLTIKDAIRWFSNRIPQYKTSLINSIASGFYPMPSDFDEISRIISFEFPLDESPPLVRYPDQGRTIVLQETETGRKYFLVHNPTGPYRFTYTLAHNPDASTLPASYVRIVALLAVSMACLKFASRYSGSVANNVDAINYRTKAQEWRAAAKDKKEQYEREARTAEMKAFADRGVAKSKVRGWRA